jgi:hypothetical protein
MIKRMSGKSELFGRILKEQERIMESLHAMREDRLQRGGTF